MSVRPEREEDVAAIHGVVAAAFKHTAEANLVDAIRASTHAIPDLSLVAEVEGAIVGHVMISWAVLRSAQTDLQVPLLAPLAVAPSHQRRGVGGELVKAVCAVADAKGLPMVLLEGDPAYYGRFGFEPAYEYGIELPLPDWAPHEAGQIMKLSAYDPGMVGSVIYPAYFDAATREREG